MKNDIDTSIYFLDDEDSEDREFIEAYERGELVPSENQEEQIRKLKEAARLTLIESKGVFLSFEKEELDRVSTKARERGIPIEQYTTGTVWEWGK